MKRKSYISSVMLTSAMTVMFSVSCERETNDVRTFSEGVISYEVSTGSPQSSAVTKSGSAPMMLVSEEGDTLYLSVSASPNTDKVMWGGEVDMKSTPITTDNLRTEYRKFNVKAFKTGTVSEPYINDETATYDSESGNWPTEIKYSWPTEYGLDFYAYAPVDVTGLTGTTYAADNKISFTYQLPAGGQKDANGKFIDAKNQKDLLFAVTKNVTASTNTGKVGFTFEHALSAIRFVGGDIEGAGTLQSITLKNLSSKGDATFDGEAFMWSNQDSRTNSYSQSFDVVLEEQTAPQDITDSDVSTTFMMIPQEIAEETAEIEINYLRPGDTEPVKFITNLPAVEWKAGYIYTYVISYSQELTISVEDEVIGLVKSNLKIANDDNSNVACYIRACIFGNWYDEDECIVGPWKTSDGDFDDTFPTEVGVPKNNWMLASDGFYYYKYPVYPGTLTGQTDSDPDGDPLFVSYTSPSVALIQDSHLIMKIGAQGVRSERDRQSIQKAWPSVWAEISGFISAEDKQ